MNKSKKEKTKRDIIYTKDEISKVSKERNETQIKIFNDNTSETQEETNNRNYVEWTTAYVSTIKILVETLNNILSDVVLKFTPLGIFMIQMNKGKQNLVINLELYKKNIGEYFCNETFLSGIKLQQLYKITNAIRPNNILTLSINRDDKQTIRLSAKNADRGSTHWGTIKLCDLVNPELTPIDTSQYKCIVAMPSNDFQKICSYAFKISNTIEIQRVEDQLIFIYKDDNISLGFGQSQAPKYLTFIENRNKDEIIQGLYNIKDLLNFSKCTAISETVKLHLDNKLPLLIEYNVGTMGIIQMYVQPQTTL